MKMNRWLSLGFLALITTSCGSNDFLYYRKPQEVQPVTVVQKIKELQGENQVDILWIIDNSGSMSSHQQSVRQNAALFIQQFTQANNLQWKMGLISTDDSDQPYMGLGSAPKLDWTSANPVTIFTNAVSRLGINGSGYEKTFLPVENALTADPGFLRPKAMLAMFIVTDAPEQSTRGPKSVNAPEFLKYLTAKKQSLDRVVTYGVLGPQDFGCAATDDPWNYAGSPYEQLIKATRGKTFPLCSSNFGRDLADLGKDLVKRVTNPKIYLGSRPKPTTIQVSYRGKALPSGTPDVGGVWTYDFDLNAIMFSDLSFAPGDDELVNVDYEIDDGYAVSQI